MHICSGKIYIPRFISKECCSLIENCLQPDPKRRLRLEQLLAHEWIIDSQADSFRGSFEMQKFWKHKRRLNSLGTERTTESESSEECSYRASTGRNEPGPISIPITHDYLSLESSQRRPDSGFDTCSEGATHRQRYNGSSPHTSAMSKSSSQDLFCSLCSSSYYTADGRPTSSNDSPQRSLISSAYFSTSSAENLNFK
jgi:serine/threonine protein kinase